jgi:hypothetical protein
MKPTILDCIIPTFKDCPPSRIAKTIHTNFIPNQVLVQVDLYVKLLVWINNFFKHEEHNLAWISHLSKSNV